MLEKIATPINPSKFVNTFSRKYKKWGNTITSKLKKTWRQNCLVFNNVIANKNNAIKYIVSAPTGTAKTENTITYCSMLPKNIKVLISTNLTDECDRLAHNINQESGEENRAISFHSKNNVTLLDASEYQVVVVTHAFYKNHFAGTKNWINLTEDRDLIIIDEAINTMKEESISLSEINIAFNLFERLFMENKYKDSEYYYKELERLLEDRDKLDTARTSQEKGMKLHSQNKTWIIPTSFGDREILSIKAPRYSHFSSILKKDKKIKFTKLLTGVNDESIDNTIRDNIKETIRKLEEFKDRQTYISNSYGEYSLNRVVDKTPKQSMVCFDATAEANKVYEIREKYHKDLIRIKKVKGVRDYSSVNLFKAITKTGKDIIDEHFAQTIIDNCEFGEKTLIVTSKFNKGYFEKLIRPIDKVIKVANWGALTGLNNWKDFDTCIIAGLNHKPLSYYQNRALINSSENVAFGEEQTNLNNTIESSDLIAEIIQAINRIRIRTVTNELGGCESANIYLTLPSKDSDFYLFTIKNEMEGINVKVWDLPNTIIVEENYCTKVIKYLRSILKIGDKININTPRDALNINNESYRDIIGKSEKKKEKFKNMLSDLGFSIIEIMEKDSRGRTRTKPTKYIQRLR